MIRTQDYKATKMKRSEQLYCGCGEKILKGIRCYDCKEKEAAIHRKKATARWRAKQKKK